MKKANKFLTVALLAVLVGYFSNLVEGLIWISVGILGFFG